MLVAYRGQEWETAAELLSAFEEAGNKLEFDFATYVTLYRDRLEEIHRNPVDADWDGVFTATSK